MSPAGLSWLQTLVGGIILSLLSPAIIRVCVWCWRKCCINRDGDGVPNSIRQNFKMKRLCCSDASDDIRVEEGCCNLLPGSTSRSESLLEGPEGSPQTKQEQAKDSRQGAVEPKREADGRPRTGLVHEFQLQDVQGKNDIKPEGRLEEVQASDGSLGTGVEQDGQSGQENLPFAPDEHSEGLRQRSRVGPRSRLRSWVLPPLRLPSWVARRLRPRYWGHLGL